MNDPRIFQIGLSLLRGVGPHLAKTLVAHCGSAEAVFSEKAPALAKIPGIGPERARDIAAHHDLSLAEAELEFLEKKGCQMHFFSDPTYPRRLKHCEDGPVVLYQKGNSELNPERSLAVVGTRASTSYGNQFSEALMRDLAPFAPSIVSGLAYGIDAMAHRGAINHGMPTLAIMAHGLDLLYPPLHRKLAEDILAAGGSLLSEYRSGVMPDKQNFPTRNRIIAGMVDAVVVVEAAAKGGALITAQLANGYHRDVFALPGRHHDRFSAGCNQLIKSHQAHLLTGVKDIKYIMRWEAQDFSHRQLPLFAELSADQQKLFALFEARSKALSLERLCHEAHFPVSKTLQELMNLELKGLIKTLPGKTYIRA